MRGEALYVAEGGVYETFKIHENTSGNLVLLLRIPEKFRSQKGQGFIYYTDEELRTSNEAEIVVYTQIPDKSVDTNKKILVPKLFLRDENIKKTSSAFPGIEWRGVRYEFTPPQMLWASLDNGFFRPDMDVSLMQNTIGRLKKLNLPSQIQDKILRGFPELGFQDTWLLMSLGEPIKAQEQEGIIEWVYPRKTFILQKGVVAQIQ